ncbi:hypothetical protein COE94_25610 [Bacillus toyonensis]|nr:hypothetical protein CN603_24375 [Bacillus toyonensis]PHB81081.1 hypothetical protein COE94_25610 [Bacillus toyonensis]
MIRILFLYQKSQIKKDKIREHDLIYSTRSKQKDNYHIVIIIYFLLILNIGTIINKYIYIEKFITNLIINDSKLQSKLLAESLLSFPLQH